MQRVSECAARAAESIYAGERASKLGVLSDGFEDNASLACLWGAAPHEPAKRTAATCASPSEARCAKPARWRGALNAPGAPLTLETHGLAARRSRARFVLSPRPRSMQSRPRAVACAAARP